MFLSLLLLTPVLCADPVPKPRPFVAAAPGTVVKVEVPADPTWNEVPADPLLTILESPAKARWVAVDPGCKVVPSADGKTATFAASKVGRYRLVVVPEAGEPVLVAVVVGKVEPQPGPGPSPGPVDPPQSELGKKFQVAFDADPGTKDEKLKVLADKVELYKQAEALAKSEGVTSLGALVTAVRAAADTLHTERLPALRKAVRAELAAAFPTDAAMTDDVRAKASATFQKIQNALKEVK